MNLKRFEPMEPLYIFEGPVNPPLLEPQIGIAYQEEESGAEVLLALNTWCLAEGIALLEDFKLSHPDQLLACLRLQAEVYFSQNRYETAWMLLTRFYVLTHKTNKPWL